ncbi:MAG: 1-acylglycerol-3-phosphate O-acyltransferase [Candidatus Binatia bacterium]
MRRIAGVGCLLLGLGGCTLLDSLVFFPDRRIPDPPPGVEERWITAEDGVRLHAWSAVRPGSRATLVWSHGNAGNIALRAEVLLALAERGLDVLAYDYRGYGKSQGRPTEAGVYLDAKAAYDSERARGVEASRIICFGESLGGAVSIHLATERPCAAVAVVATFTRLRDVGRIHYGPIALLAGDRFDALSRVRSLRVPIFVAHGDRDEVVPYSLGEQLFAAANEPKEFLRLAGARHNDIFESEALAEAIARFATRVVSGRCRLRARPALSLPEPAAMNVVLSLLFWGFVGTSSALLFPVALAIGVLTAPFDGRRTILHAFTCFWASLYTWTNPLWRVVVHDRRKIPPAGTPAVLVANHQSLLDILVLFRLFRHFKWVSKASLFRIPTIGWNMRLNRYVPLVRGDARSIDEMFRIATERLREGSSIMIFPEGTRSLDGRLQPFKHGAFTLALENRVPIVPIVVSGTSRALPKRGFVLRGTSNIVVRVLDPILPTDYASLTARDLAERVRGRIALELAQPSTPIP